jgi:lipopolysaccharide cholinephosphotransferase
MIWGFSKLRDSNTTAIEFPDMRESFNQGIFIDIFPLDSSDDGTPNMKMVTMIKQNIWDCIFNREAIINNFNNEEIWKMFAIDKDMVKQLINMSYKDTLKIFEDFCEEHLYDTDTIRCWSSEVMGRVRKYYKRQWFIKCLFC